MSLKNAVVKPLTTAERELKDQCEDAIRSGLQSFFEVGQALLVVKDKRLYRDRYATFEDYCAAEWQISRSRGYELMSAARVVSAIADTGLPEPANEAQARELARLPEDERTDAWRETLDATDGKPTAAAVKAAAERLNTDSQPAASDERVDPVSSAETPSRPAEAPTGQPSRSDTSEGDPPVATNDQSGHEPTDPAGGVPPAPPAEPGPTPGVSSGPGAPEEGDRARQPSSGAKAERSEALANWARDSDEVRNADYRKLVNKFLAMVTVNLGDFQPPSTAAAADRLLVEQIERVCDLFATWTGQVVQEFAEQNKPRLVKDSA